MKYILIIIFTYNLSIKTYAEVNHQYLDELFNVGKMVSYNNELPCILNREKNLF